MDTERHQPFHLSEDERQVGSHVCFSAKLPAKWKVTDYGIHAGTGQRQLCTNRRIQKCHSVNKYITASIMFTCSKIAIGMCFNIFQWSFWDVSYSSMKLSTCVVCFPALQTLCSHWPSVAVRHQCPYPGNVQPYAIKNTDCLEMSHFSRVTIQYCDSR